MNSTAEFLHTLNRTWPEVSKGMAIGLAVGAVIVIVVLAIIETVRNQRRKQERQDESSRKLQTYCRHRGLSPDDTALLSEMVARAGLAEPREVFDSIALFEQCVEAQFDHFDQAAVLPEAVREAGLRIRRIRERLGFKTLPQEKALISTRELPTGQILRVRSLIRPESEGVGAALVENTEIELALRLGLERAGQLVVKAGDFLQFQMTRASDGEYTFGARVREVKGQTGELLIIDHPRQIHRRQSRNHVRVPAHVPLRFRIIRSQEPEFPTEMQEASVIDVSGGGLSFSRPVALRSGDLISMNFDLHTGGFRGVQGKVLRASPIKKDTPAAGLRHHVQFLEIDNMARERIVRYVFEKQRDDNQWR